MDKVNLRKQFSLFQEFWSPKIVGQVNDSLIKIFKAKGEFIWHQHPAEDECFLVLKGRLTIKLRDREIVLEEGELFIVPRGVEHLPYSDTEAHVLLFESKGMSNTGDAISDRTVEAEWLE